ncbi:Predicted nucleic acid-binding protein, contains Zn-ribbon domain [Chryseolinea serpens]|uniref:Predicted nucleic acid-binding protein, contains Zn-ribbon domain n=1 Tax=Chryseolinea serpens TaxID=947013 RepID=A0A1M5JST7_9BACT|nr:hypothetical protein [Chryseolinea serpens]SHG43578.1 Predicted nucleic acid-binding protein, contains Zn-ribbon domain [Chryseolinea serpens]
MTGAIALDVVIGLVFIYLLYSLFATIICEIIAVQLGIRERNLKQAIRRMLEDFPETSENKVVAFGKQVSLSISEMFENSMGPAACVFYHLPIIKYFARNTFHSKPAYITKQNFSKAVLEIFRRYGGGDDLSDLEKIQNVLQGKIQHTEVLKSLKDAIDINSDTKKPYEPGDKRDYNVIFNALKKEIEGVDIKVSSLDTAQRIIFDEIKKLMLSVKADDKKDYNAIFDALKEKIAGNDEKVSSLNKAQRIIFDKIEKLMASAKSDKDKKAVDKDYDAIFDALKEKIAGNDKKVSSLDTAQRNVLNEIEKLMGSAESEKDKKAAVYRVDEMLNLFGHETRSHLTSLLKDANNDLLKFKLHLEQWFEDTMDRASGWYKQKIQVVLLIVGFIIAICFNANTLAIVHKLSVDKDAREKMVERATRAMSDPKTKLNVDKAGKLGDTAATEANEKARLDSLKTIQREVQQQLDDANSLLGSGWVDLPDNLPLVPWTPAAEDSARKLKNRGFLDYAVVDVLVGDSVNRKILKFPQGMTSGVLSCLEERDVWSSAEVFTGANTTGTKIAVDNSFGGYFFYLWSNIFSAAFWGYLLTAVAISLGAPFWFDMLNKLIQIRGAVKEPTQTQVAGGTASKDTGLSDPAHPLNRKG